VAILAYALLSRRLDRWWFSMPVVMVLIGLAVGADGFGWIGIDIESHTVKTIAELTLSLMLFHDAVRIDLRALKRGFAVPLRLLGIGLPLMLVLGTLVAWGMLPSIGLIGALLVGTMLAPTDAALGAAVVEDERLPMRIRQGLNVESGLNAVSRSQCSWWRWRWPPTLLVGRLGRSARSFCDRSASASSAGCSSEDWGDSPSALPPRRA
jgi:NhaP-type Na+/H+ or K+/H+ antiporter